jgi:hypothetical protein
MIPVLRPRVRMSVANRCDRAVRALTLTAIWSVSAFMSWSTKAPASANPALLIRRFTDRTARVDLGVDRCRRFRSRQISGNHRHSYSVLGSQALGEKLELRCVAGDEHDVGPAPGEGLGKALAEARRGTRDQGGGIGVVEHVETPREESIEPAHMLSASTS